MISIRDTNGRDISPLADHVLVYEMEKGEKITKSGIILRDDNGREDGIRPRWCKVYKVGSKVDYVKPEEWVLVEHGRWTMGFDVELETGTFYVQRIDTDAILLVSEVKPSELD